MKVEIEIPNNKFQISNWFKEIIFKNYNHRDHKV